MKEAANHNEIKVSTDVSNTSPYVSSKLIKLLEKSDYEMKIREGRYSFIEWKQLETNYRIKMLDIKW